MLGRRLSLLTNTKLDTLAPTAWLDSAWSSECVCVEGCTLLGGYTGGMSIPIVDPWERSSIARSRNCSNEARHIAFYPDSLQLGTAHSFGYGHNRECLYTQTLCNGQRVPTPLYKKHPCMPLLSYCTNIPLWGLNVLSIDTSQIIFVCLWLRFHCAV